MILSISRVVERFMSIREKNLKKGSCVHGFSCLRVLEPWDVRESRNRQTINNKRKSTFLNKKACGRRAVFTAQRR